MFCTKCGDRLKSDAKFCTKCGAKIEQNKTNGYAIVSLVIGFISLFLCFTISVFVIPLAIIGLIFGLACKEKCSEKKAGIIMNVISIIIPIVILIVIILLLFFKVLTFPVVESNDYTDIYGTWNCKVNNSNEYNIVLSFGNSSDYTLNPYNNYNSIAFGKYIYVDDNITLFGESVLNNGIIDEDNTVIIFTISTKDNHLILENKSSSLTYICDR